MLKRAFPKRIDAEYDFVLAAAVIIFLPDCVV
jgi:hypothetical protein